MEGCNSILFNDAKAVINITFPQFTNISFTIEQECNGKISFLDTLVSRNNGAISVDVYRKPTHTDRFLDFNSHHDKKHKESTAATLLHRALNLPNTSEGKERELNHVYAAL